MSGNDSKAADVGHRDSTRTSMRLSRVEGDEDDYDVQAMMISDGLQPADVAQNDANVRMSRPEGDHEDYDVGAMMISDGFRPADVAQNHANPRLSRPEADDEDYDMGVMMISDGFRPTAVAQNHANPSLPRPDADDEDYDMGAMMISDGFRPTDVAQNHANPSNASYTGTPTAAQPPTSRPSSISKKTPLRQGESLLLRHDGVKGPLDETGPARNSTPSGAAPFVRSESPYQGPSGPSFPYQMYAQNVGRARTASIATTSTAPAPVSERPYNGPRGPTHPYQMYPQNTVPEVDGQDDRITPAPIPVGFPGSTDNYQRRIGPEGEEAADMIGPDGHTEQLPPYTRYPDEAYARKARAAELPTPVSTQTQVIPGAGGIGLATRNPEYSTDDLHGANTPQSHQSVRSLRTDDASRHQMNAEPKPVTDEKAAKPLKKWQVVAKRKVWGVVPCWAFGMTALIFVMLAIVLGAILGTFLNRPKRPTLISSSSASITYDATPLPTVPPNLPPLVEGTFAMPIMTTRNPNICFKDTTQAQAWNCNIVYSQLVMTVNKLFGEPDTAQYSLSVSYNKSYTMDSFVYSYGMQPPQFHDVQLILVNDTYENDRGPAWAFEMAYNKTVIIPEALFTAAASEATASHTEASKLRRGEPLDSGFSGDFGKRKGVAQTGEKPWICHWDGTILETFIYASQNSSHNPRFMSGTSSSTTTSSDEGPSAALVSRPTDFPSTLPFTGRKQIAARATASPTTNVAPTDQAASTTTVTSSSSTNYFDSQPFPSEYKAAYPRVVKVEERRIPGPPSAQPWCQQYEIRDDGKPAEPARDSSGNFIVVQIGEEEPGFGPSDSPKFIRRNLIERYLGVPLEGRGVGSDMSDCGCMWWST